MMLWVAFRICKQGQGHAECIIKQFSNFTHNIHIPRRQKNAALLVPARRCLEATNCDPRTGHTLLLSSKTPTTANTSSVRFTGARWACMELFQHRWTRHVLLQSHKDVHEKQLQTTLQQGTPLALRRAGAMIGCSAFVAGEVGVGNERLPHANHDKP